jgi:hypothetical protein
MAEKSFPWTNNATGDGTSGGYTALEWSEIWRKAFLGGGEASQGVCKGVDNELAVTGTASPLAVNTGAAFVYGKFYQNTASVNLTVSTPVVGTTGGHVILRLDWTAQTVRLVAVRNTDGVNSTPSLTQSTSTQWEIRLATFTITTGGVITVTDARAYVHMAQRVATANIDDGAVTTTKIADSNVTTIKLADANVTTAKIADANVTTGKLADASVTNVKIGTDAVDDTQVGNRVPQFYRRQGGSATDWNTAGTTTQTPTAVRMQAGVVNLTFSSNTSVSTTITFPVAFSAKPIVIVSNLTDQDLNPDAFNITTSGCDISMYANVAISGTKPVAWLAIGPE